MAQLLAGILCHQKLKHSGMPAEDGRCRPDSVGLGTLGQCRIWASSLCELESHWKSEHRRDRISLASSKDHSDTVLRRGYGRIVGDSDKDVPREG